MNSLSILTTTRRQQLTTVVLFIISLVSGFLGYIVCHGQMALVAYVVVMSIVNSSYLRISMTFGWQLLGLHVMMGTIAVLLVC